MAGSSSKVTAEEMEKAMADLDDLYARPWIPDECKFYCTQAEKWAKKLEERAERKKLCVMPPHKLQMILNYKCRPLDDRDNSCLELLEELVGKEKHKDLTTLFRVCDTFARHHHDVMRSYQEKVRHEYETNGYVMYKATDDDDEEQEEAVVHQRFRGGGGRRRYRPGVTKSGRGGAVKRLN